MIVPFLSQDIEFFFYILVLKINEFLHKLFTFSQMVHLSDGIYATETSYNYAKGGGSFLASHVARRLMSGVFKNEILLKCIFTGTAPRAHGKEKQLQPVQGLDSTAREVILSKFSSLYI